MRIVPVVIYKAVAVKYPIFIFKARYFSPRLRSALARGPELRGSAAQIALGLGKRRKSPDVKSATCRRIYE